MTENSFRARVFFPKAAAAALIGAAFALILIFSAESAEAAGDALALCASRVIPSLFPAAVVSGLLVETGSAAAIGRRLDRPSRALFRVSGAGAGAIALGLLAGYPVGGRTACALYASGDVSRGEALRLLAFSNCCGPAFAISAVGTGVFGSARAGIFIYICHAVSALAVALIFRGCGKNVDEPAVPTRGYAAVRRSAARRGSDTQRGSDTKRGSGTGRTPGFAAAFTRSVSSAAGAMLNIAAFVTFFSVLARLASGAGLDSPFVSGTLEFTRGVYLLQGLSRANVTAASAIIGFGGLSVACQTASFASESGLPMRTYFVGKLLHAAIAAALSFIFYSFFF